MEALHVRGGQIDAVAAEVLGDVLEVLDDLEGGADRVGAADALRGGGPGDGEHEAADRVGRQFAVGEQVVVGLVARDQLVLTVRGDQAEERRGGQRAAADRGLQAAQQGVAGARSRGVEHAVKLGFQGVEDGEAVAGLVVGDAEGPGVGAAGGQVAVADVVDQTGEAVDGHEVVAPGPGQEEGRHREVLGGGLVEGGPFEVGGAGRTGGRHRGLPGKRTAHAEFSRGVSEAIAVTSPVLHC